MVDGKAVRIETEIVSYLGADGKLVNESITSFTRRNIRKKFANIDTFISRWSATARKKAILDELKEYDVLIDAVREANPHLEDVDIFDIICHVAFDCKPMTRRERANNVKKRDYLSKYSGQAREVLESLLEKYATNGVLQLEDPTILSLDPFSKIGNAVKIMRLFGGKSGYDKAIKELENELYKVA